MPLRAGDVGAAFEQGGGNPHRNPDLWKADLRTGRDVEVSRSHIDQNGDGVLHHRAPGLKVGIGRLGGEKLGLRARDVDARRDRPRLPHFRDLHRRLVIMDRVEIDGVLRVHAAQLHVVIGQFGLDAQPRGREIGRRRLRHALLHTPAVADGGPEIRLPPRGGAVLLG